MRTFTLFSRHSGFAELASAYADGELAPRELSRFEAHLATCDQCMTAVTQARQLKSAVGRLPLVAVPRSFRITAAMAREVRPVPSAARTPLYLGLARAGAALSVLAFASVLAFGALDGGSGGQGDDDSSTFRQASGDLVTAAAGSAPEKAAQDAFATSAPTPMLAPPSVGEAVSSGVPTVPAATPDSRSSGSGSAPPLSGETTDNPHSEPGATALALDTPMKASSGDDDGLRTVLVVLGVVAAAMVVLLIGLETSRRTRRP